MFENLKFELWTTFLYVRTKCSRSRDSVQLATNYSLHVDESQAVYENISIYAKAEGSTPAGAYRPPVKVLIGLQ